MVLRRALPALILGLLAAGAGRASAQCGYGGFGAYGAWDVGRLYSVLADRVPHFAAFPPVYYSVPVPRTYGYSPFAYPPGTMTPEVDLNALPQIIENPYCREASQGVPSAVKSEDAEPAAERTTEVRSPSEPLVIRNPYVTPSQVAAAGPILRAAVAAR